MPKLFDENGNEVTAFTEEELQNKLKEATDKLSSEKQTELEKLQSDLKEKEKALETIKGTAEGRSIGKLREAKEEAEKKLEEFKTTVMGQLGDIKKTQDETALLNRISLLVDGDVELSQKVKLQYESIVKDTDDDKSKNQKLADSYKLVIGSSPSQSVLSRVLGGGGGNNNGNNMNNSAWPQNLVELGRKMGLNDKDFEKKTYVRR